MKSIKKVGFVLSVLAVGFTLVSQLSPYASYRLPKVPPPPPVDSSTL